MSICSAHQEKDPNCPACQVEIDFPEPDCGLVTCSRCNYVYYAYCDICPLCYKENNVGQ